MSGGGPAPDAGSSTDTPVPAGMHLSVEAGRDLVAYPCVPVTLTARFSHPGATDGHTAVWDPGDDTARPAVVREVVDAAGAQGTALVTHRYGTPGIYEAACTVRDGSGAVAVGRRAVACVELLNAGFESGFRDLPVGQVANYWQPYVPHAPTTSDFVAASSNVGAVVYTADEYVVHGGQRSQRIGGSRAFRAGLLQRLAANPGWDYQATVWYQLAGASGGYARIGVDPDGGTDANAPDVVWSLGAAHFFWVQLAVRVTACGAGVTVFLEAGSDARGGRATFDDAAVVPYPCRLMVPTAEAAAPAVTTGPAVSRPGAVEKPPTARRRRSTRT